MLNEIFDVVFFDNVGTTFTSSTPCFVGVGGSELQIILLAEYFTQKGKKVLVLNNNSFPCKENNVLYYPNEAIKHKKIKCKNLIINRCSKIETNNIDFSSLFFLLQDIYNQEHVAYFQRIQSQYPKVIFVTVSKWLKSILPQNLNIVAIHNSIPDWIYDFKPKYKNNNKFIYCSAAFKGLEETIEVWKKIKQNNQCKKIELVVSNPGYDLVDVSLLEKNKIKFLGNLSLFDLVEEIASSAGLFYINKIPETFCIVAALANALKTRTHILCINNFGALPEILNNNQLITNNYNKFTEDFLKYYISNKYDCLDVFYRSDEICVNWEKILIKH